MAPVMISLSNGGCFPSLRSDLDFSQDASSVSTSSHPRSTPFSVLECTVTLFVSWSTSILVRVTLSSLLIVLPFFPMMAPTSPRVSTVRRNRPATSFASPSSPSPSSSSSPSSFSSTPPWSLAITPPLAASLDLAAISFAGSGAGIGSPATMASNAALKI